MHKHVIVPRQKSRLEMNRRIKWSQTPPNLDDYAPECLQSSALGPLQQAAPAAADPAESQGGQKRPNATPQRVSVKVPKASPHGSPGDSVCVKFVLCSMYRTPTALVKFDNHLGLPLQGTNMKILMVMVLTHKKSP